MKLTKPCVSALLQPFRHHSKAARPFVDRSLSFLALDNCISTLLKLIAIASLSTIQPTVFSSFGTDIIGNRVVALRILLAGTASLGDATREDSLAFGGGLARRRGIGIFAIRSGSLASKSIWSVTVSEDDKGF